MAEETNSGVGPTQDGFASLDLLRVLRTPSMSSIGQPSEPVVFESFKQPDFFDRSQYAPQQGSSYTQLHDDPQQMRSPETSPVQFDVQFVGASKVSVTLGWVRCVNPDSAVFSPIVDWEPTIDGVPLSADPPPEIGVAAGQVLYCEVKTDNKGIVVETPRIVVAGPDDTGTHYQPPQLTPREGALRYPLAKFESAGEGLIATQLQQGGPILVQPTLWEGRNVGGEREIYKERQTAGDFYEFRTLEQLIEDESQGQLTPISVLKPAPEGGDGSTIPVRFLTQKPQEGEGSGGEEAQIKVLETDGGDGIIIRGNSFDLLEGEGFVTNLRASDGLVKSAGFEPFGLFSGPVTIVDACGQGVHNFLFRKGLLDQYFFTATTAPS
jgi:hypothetical protein